MSARASRHPPRPLCVGITGHRPNRMPAPAWPRIRKQLAQVMEEIEAAHAGLRPMLLSGLAEGADRLAAFAALGRGWRLGAVLAFHRTRYEQDFPEPHAVGEFRALLAAAEMLEEPAKGADAGKPPEDGYDAVGRRLLALSSILIAVWDGEGSRGRGGTVEVIAQARERGIPVIWINARKDVPPRRLEPAACAVDKGAAPARRRGKRAARAAHG
ncbi:MAG: VWA domain-containing protein [Hyphomicrobiaceae bacterium]|nr:MAG: VWA domain-containing protein [Hyphomicrobiaceae bacterium]